MTGSTAPQVELLLVPQCPYADIARSVLHQALRELGLQVEVIERVGEHPSPAVVVDGIDVMTGTAPAADASCRLDLPTLQRIRQALIDGLADDPGSYPAELAVGVTSDRIATVSPAARQVHKAILARFAAHGRAPDLHDPHEAPPAGHDLAELLTELHGSDVIQLGAHGSIRAAYPFSGTPTTHVVAIDGGPRVYAMCAIDALGISAMLQRDTTVTTADPVSSEPITVVIHNGQTVWRPETAVAFVGSDTTVSAADSCTPGDIAAADRCCGTMNLFATKHNAQTWTAANPHVAGTILSKEQALRLGIDIFGPLLDD